MPSRRPGSTSDLPITVLPLADLRPSSSAKVSGPRRNTGGEGDEGWRKLHLGVDGSSVIVACALTEPTADDAITGIRLVEVDGHLTRVTADPAYDTLAFYGAAGARGASCRSSRTAATRSRSA